MEMTFSSHTPAHDASATVAPFRAWRGLQRFIARGPEKATITIRRVVTIFNGSYLAGADYRGFVHLLQGAHPVPESQYNQCTVVVHI